MNWIEPEWHVLKIVGEGCITSSYWSEEDATVEFYSIKAKNPNRVVRVFKGEKLDW